MTVTQFWKLKVTLAFVAKIEDLWSNFSARLTFKIVVIVVYVVVSFFTGTVIVVWHCCYLSEIVFCKRFHFVWLPSLHLFFVMN